MDSHANSQQNSQQPAPPKSAATAEPALAPNKPDSDAAMPFSEDETALQEMPVPQQPTSASQASLSNGFSFGFGEILLALIVACPALLLSWKKRSQS